MKVVVLSRTPLAAAPWELAKAIQRYTDIDVQLVQERADYQDGRRFPRGLLIGEPGAAQALKQADLWHVHNSLPRMISPTPAIPILAQFHSVPRMSGWQELSAVAKMSYAIRQPAQMAEYVGLPTLPNVIDPDEYRPDPFRAPSPIIVAFAPTSRAVIGVPCSKGYHEVLGVMRRVLANRQGKVLFDLIEGAPYEQNLARKRRAHILIDDIATGSWHRTSLEGACFGCAVINASSVEPWVHAVPETLLAVIGKLVDDPAFLSDKQERARAWVLSRWHAMDAAQEYAEAYRRALE